MDERWGSMEREGDFVTPRREENRAGGWRRRGLREIGCGGRRREGVETFAAAIVVIGFVAVSAASRRGGMMLVIRMLAVVSVGGRGQRARGAEGDGEEPDRGGCEENEPAAD